MRTTTAPVKTVVSLTPGPDDVIGVHTKGCGQQQFQSSAAGSRCAMFFSVLFVFWTCTSAKIKSCAALGLISVSLSLFELREALVQL